ncbi:DUF4352 domain-containing protein [Streptomyces sp. NPDC090052]|uniref:DUF4352 domain-containing protein n=1 Tax=Streptomyces sp. NPDC090052 TaxID=3365931 RepID=UPI0038025AE6
MSQQYPNDQQPQQPYQGGAQAPQQQGHPQGQQPPTGPQAPQWGQPGYQAPQTPQGPKKSWVARHKILTGVLGVVAFIVVVSIATSGGSDDSTKKSDTAATAPEKPAAKAKADDKPAAKKDTSKSKPAAGPIVLTASSTTFRPSVLADGSAYTSVLVTIKNNGDKALDVNPLYFTITSADGTKSTSELGEDEKQIDTMKLSPGEKATGTVTAKGAFTAKYVTFTEGLIGDDVRAPVK